MVPFVLTIIFFAFVTPHETTCGDTQESFEVSHFLTLPDHFDNPGRLVGLDPSFSPTDTPGKPWKHWFAEWQKRGIVGQVILVKKYTNPKQDGLSYYFDTAGWSIPPESYVARYHIICENGLVRFIPVPLFFNPEPQSSFTHQQVFHSGYQSPLSTSIFVYPSQMPRFSFAAEFHPYQISTFSLPPRAHYYAIAPQYTGLHPLPHLNPSSHAPSPVHLVAKPLQKILPTPTLPQHSSSPDISPDLSAAPQSPCSASQSILVTTAKSQENLTFAEEQNDASDAAIQAAITSLASTTSTPSPVLSNPSSDTPAQKESIVFGDHQKGHQQQDIAQANFVSRRQQKKIKGTNRQKTLARQHEQEKQERQLQEEETKAGDTQECLHCEANQEAAKRKQEATQQRKIERVAQYAILAKQITDAIGINDFSKAWHLIASIQEENPTFYRQQLLFLVQHEQVPDILVSAARELLSLKASRNKGPVIQTANDKRTLLVYLLRHTPKRDRAREALLKEAKDLGISLAGLEWHQLQMNSHQGFCRNSTCVHTKAQTFLEQHNAQLGHTFAHYQTRVVTLKCSQKRAQAATVLQDLLTQAKIHLPEADYKALAKLVQPLLPVPVGPLTPTRQQQAETRHEPTQLKQKAQQEREQEINARHSAALIAMNASLKENNFQAAGQKAKEHLALLMQDALERVSTGVVQENHFQYALDFIQCIEQTRQKDACFVHQVTLLLALQETINLFRLNLPLSKLKVCMKFFNRIKLPEINQDPVALLAHRSYVDLSHILNPYFIAISQIWLDFSQIPAGPDQRNNQRILIISKTLKLVQEITTDNDAWKLVQSLINFRTTPENLFTILVEETIACHVYQQGKSSPEQQEVAAQRYIFPHIESSPSLFISYAYRVFSEKSDISHKLQGILALTPYAIASLNNPDQIANFLHILNLYTNKSGPFEFTTLMKSALRGHSKKNETWQTALEQEQDRQKGQTTWSEWLSNMCVIQ